MQNPHPLVVHFPLALLLTSALAALYAAFRTAPSAEACARALLWLGTGACAVAAITGFLGAQSVAPVRLAAGTLSEHQDYAYVLLGLAAALSGWSWVAWSRRRSAPGPRPLWVLGQVALVVLLILTGKEGGELAYRFGVGTALTAPGGPLHEPAGRAPGAPGTPSTPTPGAPSKASPPRPAGSDFR